MIIRAFVGRQLEIHSIWCLVNTQCTLQMPRKVQSSTWWTLMIILTGEAGLLLQAASFNEFASLFYLANQLCKLKIKPRAQKTCHSANCKSKKLVKSRGKSMDFLLRPIGSVKSYGSAQERGRDNWSPAFSLFLRLCHCTSFGAHPKIGAHDSDNLNPLENLR